MLCRVLEVSRSGFYAWSCRDPSQRDLEGRKLKTEIAALHTAIRRTYGSPRIHADLKARHVSVSRKRIARLMREAGLSGRPPRWFRRTTDSDNDHPVAENLLARNFETTFPNQVWAADILHTDLVLEALNRALGRHQPGRGLLQHSDRGSQYASGGYRRELARRKIRCSMSRRGDCWDNAVVESFFGTLKTELIYRRP